MLFKPYSLDLNRIKRTTHKQVFLRQMQHVVFWAALVGQIAPICSKGRNSRLPFALETMLGVYFMQRWFSLSGLMLEEAFFDTPLYREFFHLVVYVRLPAWRESRPALLVIGWKTTSWPIGDWPP